ncbi:MAG: HAD family hydrolase [Microbacteriaceae bacterium]
MSGKARAIAFFDLDNTLVRGSTMFLYALTAWKQRQLRLIDLIRFGWHQLTFLTVGETAAHSTVAQGRGLSLIAGRSVEALSDIAHATARDAVGSRLITASLDRARTHLANGDEVWIVTASPKSFAEIVAADLGFTGALGTEVESKDGFATGQLVDAPLHGARKVGAITELARAKGVELADCSAYSDSHNDIPMLSAVGRAYAVNPDRELAREAELRGWEIIPIRQKRQA